MQRYHPRSAREAKSKSDALTDTAEGLDNTMSLGYYAHRRAITQLQPLLVQSPKPATAVSVYAAGLEAKLVEEDLSLRSLDKYSYSQARPHMIYMKTLFFEALATPNKGKLALVHIFPGLVIGPGFKEEYPAWFQFLWKWISTPLVYLLLIHGRVGSVSLLWLSSGIPRNPSSLRQRMRGTWCGQQMGSWEAGLML
jgi:hypothetical protein